MGIYLNPDNEGFQRAVRSEIYVDKTKLIAFTNSVLATEERFLCVSRPRRFGKSMAAKMLAAYYSRGCDSRQLFIWILRKKSAGMMDIFLKTVFIYIIRSLYPR